MFVPLKPHLFGNKCHTIPCALYKVIYHVEIVDGEDHPRDMGRKEFDEKVSMEGYMV